MALPTPDPTRTAIVTGASSGIGIEVATELARRGHGVTLVARREDKLREVAERLASTYRVRAEVTAADLTEPDAREHLISATAARGLTADVLVNNAGFSTMGPVSESEPDREIAMVRLDVEAVVHLCSLLVPGMVSRGRGAVLNVASTAAFQPLPGQAGYGGSKAFVLSYSRALAQEVRGTGVTVTALCPGPVETGFAAAAGLSEQQAGDSLPKFMWVSSPEVARQAIAALEKGRDLVIPGASNRVGARLGYLAPRRLLLPLLARQHPALSDG